jgi:UDP-glucose 4-epimerase
MKIFVTGSTGGIGQYVVRRLVEAGHQVCAMDLRAQPHQPDYEYIPGDVRDSSLVRRAMQGAEAAVHLAAIPYDMDRQDELILDTNLRGTWNVLIRPGSQRGAGGLFLVDQRPGPGRADHPGPVPAAG